MRICASILIQRNYRKYRRKYINNIIKIQSLFRRFNAMSILDNLRNERLIINRRFEINNSEDINNYNRDRLRRQYDHRIKVNYEIDEK